MQPTLELLRGMPLLRAVPATDLAELQVTRVERERGGSFFHQGDPGDAVYGIVTGRVRVVKQSPNGREVCLELLGTGDLIAALAVMRQIPFPASGVAAEDSLCVRVSADAFRRLVQRHPWLTTRILEVVSQRLLDASDSRLSLATEPVETRLAQVLLKLAEKYAVLQGDSLIFAASLTRQQLADLAGTTVESTIRVMSRWTRDGLLRSCASRITVTDPSALRRLAGRCPGDPESRAS